MCFICSRGWRDISINKENIMQGYHFLVIGENRILTQGKIMRPITDEYWLCKFVTKPVVTRVIRIDQIETWNLFANDQELGEFIADTTSRPEEPEDNGDDGDESGEEE
jgi:hypothetical protein